MARSGQGFLWRLKPGARSLRLFMNLWPPFRGLGVRVARIAADYREVDVELRMRLLNRNYVGTHFGGALFAMADPFFMIMMMHNLGSGYVVWDKAGAIRFLKPGRGTIHARFVLTQAMVDEAMARTQDGEKFEPTYALDLVNAEGEAVARYEKTLHIRRKREG